MNSFLQKRLFVIILLFSSIIHHHKLLADCPSGYTSTQINWDYQYYRNSELPGSGINYMMGKNTMTLSWSSADFYGVVGEHTGETNTFGTGNDLKFLVEDGTITLTFLNPVQNLQFTVHDIDNTQKIAPRAYNTSNNKLKITLARVSGSAGTLSGSGGTTPSYYNGNSYNTSSTGSSVNITVAGPVQKIVLNMTKSSSGSDPIYISDITACSPGSDWATDYQAISAPETGQPTHMLIAYDNVIYVVNKLDNTATELYRDTTMTRLNTMAYDPYHQMIYYCNSEQSSTNLTVYKYDVKAGIRSVFINNVNDFGIQTFSNGMSTAGAGFYDGYLFLGQDTNVQDSTPVAIYRIDIDTTTGDPIMASRFWGANSVAGGKKLYDWGDFVINDGVLYNFSTAVGNNNNTQLQHFNLNTQQKEAGYDYPSDTLSQASLDYQGNIFSIRLGNYYQLYNKTDGTFGPKVFYSGIPAGAVLTDGAEAFKYPYDYGDAPQSYGYASHVFRVKPDLMIGSKVDYEMKGYYSSSANADDDDQSGTGNGTGSDEDGVDTTTFNTNPIKTSNASYTVQVKVTNKTGSNAYLYAYLDFNRNGNFNDAGERSVIKTIPSSASTNTVSVVWNALTGGNAGASYVRFRIASDSTELRRGSGYAKSGEVEDYQINIHAATLPVELITFTGKAEENTTVLNWSTASERNNNYFEIQRSTPSNNWETIGTVKGNGNSIQIQNYTFIDKEPKPSTNYYRLKQVDFDSNYEYSFTISVNFEQQNAENKNEIVVFPNPTVGEVYVKSSNQIAENDSKQIDVFNMNGQQLYTAPYKEQQQTVDLKYYENGIYYLKIGNQLFKIVKN